MKIAISSAGKGMESMLDSRFGRCNYFVLYDAASGLIKAVENRGQTSGGGAGIAAAQQIIDEGVEALITGSLGPNAYNLIKTAGIKVYRCENTEVKKAIELLNENKLEELNEAGPSHAGLA